MNWSFSECKSILSLLREWRFLENLFISWTDRRKRYYDEVIKKEVRKLRNWCHSIQNVDIIFIKKYDSGRRSETESDNSRSNSRSYSSSYSSYLKNSRSRPSGKCSYKPSSRSRSKRRRRLSSKHKRSSRSSSESSSESISKIKSKRTYRKSPDILNIFDQVEDY